VIGLGQATNPIVVVARMLQQLLTPESIQKGGQLNLLVDLLEWIRLLLLLLRVVGMVVVLLLMVKKTGMQRTITIGLAM
jgi:hypothetical protein